MFFVPLHIYVETRCHESRGRISMNGICVAVTSGQQHGAHSYRVMEKREQHQQ